MIVSKKGRKMKQKLEDLKFNITEDMSNLIIEIISINQMLKDDKLCEEEKKYLKDRKKELTNLFIKEFKKNNTKQIKTYNDIMNK